MNEKASRKRRFAPIAIVSLVVELLAVLLRGWGLGGNVVVRCHDGHVFTTLWIPGVSVKSLRLGFWRVQRCPVGRHWSLVSPVPRSELGPYSRRRAAATHDVRVP